MSQASDNHDYYCARARQAFDSAMRAREPGVRRLHLEMAEMYEARSQETGPAMPLNVVISG